jgi:diamine N-acetyltransferase
MMTITEASIYDIQTIKDIAHKTWPDTYEAILSKEQIDYMLGKMYSDAALTNDLNKGHHFILAKEDLICLGFASFEHGYLNSNFTKLHKLYFLPETQGKGFGKLLLERVMFLAQENHSDTVLLNVNKFNKAYTFYKKMGFEIVKEEDIDIGNGYLMEDYQMEKKVLNLILC